MRPPVRTARTLTLLSLALVACSPSEPTDTAEQGGTSATAENEPAAGSSRGDLNNTASEGSGDTPVASTPSGGETETSGSAATSTEAGAEAESEAAPAPINAEVILEAIGSCPADALSINLVRPHRLAALTAIAEVVAPATADTDINGALLALLARGLDAPLPIPAERVRLQDANFVGWCTPADGAPSLFLNADAVVSPPADGGRPVALNQSLRMQQQSGVVYIAGASDLDRMASRRAANADGVIHPMLEPLSSDEQWGTLITESIGWTLHRPLPTEHWLDWADGEPVLLAMAADGRIDLVASADRHDALSTALGRSQSWANAAVGQWQRTWPSEAAPIGAWLNRLQQSAFDGLTLTATDASSHLTISAPFCQGLHRNLLRAGALLTIVGAAGVDEALAPRAFTAPDPLLQRECPPFRPTGGLNTSLARVAPDPSAQPAIVALFDVAAVANTLLPSLAGLWPGALTEEAMNAAGGPSPLGLEGWNDPDGDGVFYIEPVTNRRTLVLYPGGRTLMEGNAEVLGGQLVTLSNRMVARTDDVAHVELRLNQSGETSLWEEFASLGQPTTVAALMANSIVLTPVVARSGAQSALAEVLQGGPLIGLALDAERGLEFWLPNAPSSARGDDDALYRRAVADLLSGAMGMSGMTVSPALERTGENLAAMVAELSVESTDQGVRLFWAQTDTAWTRSLTTMLLVAAPVVGNALPEIDLSGISERMTREPLRLPPGMVVQPTAPEPQ